MQVWFRTSTTLPYQEMSSSLHRGRVAGVAVREAAAPAVVQVAAWGLVQQAGWGAGAQAAEAAWDPEELVPARDPAGLSRAVEQVGLVQDGPGPPAPRLVAAHLEWAVVEVDQVAVRGGSPEAQAPGAKARFGSWGLRLCTARAC